MGVRGALHEFMPFRIEKSTSQNKKAEPPIIFQQVSASPVVSFLTSSGSRPVILSPRVSPALPFTQEKVSRYRNWFLLSILQQYAGLYVNDTHPQRYCQEKKDAENSWIRSRTGKCRSYYLSVSLPGLTKAEAAMNVYCRPSMFLITLLANWLHFFSRAPSIRRARS